MGFRQITKIDQDGQKQVLVKVFEIEAWQLVVTAVDCKAFAIADGSCEIGTPYWSDPARADALSQRDQQILLINLVWLLDSRGWLVR